jgi:hypothetical protein
LNNRLMRKTPALTACASWPLASFVRTIILVLVIGAVCSACTRDRDDERIRQRIAEGAGLAEAHEIGDLLELTTEQIRAMPMRLDRRGIKGFLWQTFRHYGTFALLYPRPTIEIAEDAREATTEFPFLIVKKALDIPGLDALRDDPMAWVDAVDDQADLYRLRLQWIKQDGDWLVDLAFLERFSGAGFE